MHVFGPVPSRRLGRSLGINHIPPKICSYACRYCQLGNAITMSIERNRFFEPSAIREEVARKLEELSVAKAHVDYMAFVPDGEPTLDARLGETAELLKFFGIPLAIISNASLVSLPSVREDLAIFDWVSLKVDAVRRDVWRALDRPHRDLSLEKILQGVTAFAESYRGHLETETMLVAGINDQEDHLEEMASFLEPLEPAVCRLSSPTRPPACSDVTCVDEKGLAAATSIFLAHHLDVRILNAYEGNDFTRTGDLREALLSILSVHPMKEIAVAGFLEDQEKSSGDGKELLSTLLQEEEIITTLWRGERFYARNLRKASKEERS